MDDWLQSISSNPLILRTQSMYQFLCVDANMPPPYLEIHWRNSTNGSFDEMEMDDLFEKHLDEEEGEDGNMENGCLGDIEGEWDEDEDFTVEGQIPGTVFEFNGEGGPGHRGQGEGIGSGQNRIGSGQKSNGFNSKRASNTARSTDAQMMGEDDNDGLDIQSLSVVEAEFFFNKDDKGKSQADIDAAKRTINLDAFHIIKVIGKGSFGKVFLVRDKAHQTLHALKVLKKDYIIRKNQVEHTKTERSVLGYVHHPFIVGLTMAFQTSDKLFFVLDYCSGGELFFHLGKVGRFAEDRAKFYAAQITLALEYVHGLDIIYRDLKPENVLLDQHGNVRLTDFGLSKEGVSDHSTGATSFCGTPEYIAPEVLLRQGHGRAVDWWSLGALLYEMITGLPPFYSRNRETMFEKIMKAELNFPPFMSDDAKDLLGRLLIRDPKQRLGSGDRDAAELKEHPFFKDTDFKGLAEGRIPPPWTPTVMGSLDTSQFDLEFTSMLPVVSPDVRDAYFGSLDKAFVGFTFEDKTAPLTKMMGMTSSSVRSGPAASLLATSFKNQNR
eukprot:CAMPEP_0119051196 /NCGR_PEP_ID=MMETSP1177-20130426/72895_1 /TAXON_ID=2985 /ORGANISM="Ochromonas sp, Strain CCMP1899" /LENGTH=551 /DNA_ID=CAMNT_0007030321 /DNA_START=447 /DNA_END=2105 /DNA_ORIENTATION=+